MSIFKKAVKAIVPAIAFFVATNSYAMDLRPAVQEKGLKTYVQENATFGAASGGVISVFALAPVFMGAPMPTTGTALIMGVAIGAPIVGGIAGGTYGFGKYFYDSCANVTYTIYKNCADTLNRPTA